MQIDGCKDKKFPCRDCKFCQWCSDERCRICRQGVTDAGCRSASNDSQSEKSKEDDENK